jgi:hypothetical protein
MGSSRSGERDRRGRAFMTILLTVGVFGAMTAFGGMSYASQVVGGGGFSPSEEQYCPAEVEPDANGDLHSNCHTGSKLRGAGGEDKSGSDK